MSAVLKLTEEADKYFLKLAREQLSERLKDGKDVGRLNLLDILDGELCGPRSEMGIRDVHQILTADYPDICLYRDRFIDGVIERYLNAHEDLIEEEAAAIEADREEA